MAEDVEAFLQYLSPELAEREPSERAVAGLMHIVDAIQKLRWIADAHTSKKSG